MFFKPVLLLALASSLSNPVYAAQDGDRANVPENMWLCNPGDMPRLCALAEEDQQDRSGTIDWTRVVPRDAERRQQVLQILATEMLNTPGDYFHAALVMQHGMIWDEYAAAHILSMRGLQLRPGDPNLQRMVAASWDRMMHKLEKKQWFGTNRFSNPDGTWMPRETRPDYIPQYLIDLWSQPWVDPE